MQYILTYLIRRVNKQFPCDYVKTPAVSIMAAFAVMIEQPHGVIRGVLLLWAFYDNISVTLKERRWVLMLIIAQVIGFAAVGLYLLSYQLKKRAQIVWVTFVSNIFYVSQYFLLGAFSGAIMDILSTAASFLAARKNAPHFKKHAKWIALATVLVITGIGLMIAIVQRDWIELLPIAGTVFQTIGLWYDDEQTIRKFGLCGAPFWLGYNFISKAYGASLGSAFAIISIVVSLVRYRKNETDK